MNDLKNHLKIFAEKIGHTDELYDPDYEDGTWMIGAVETQETIDDYVDASNNYAECARKKFGEVAGYKFVSFAEVQVRKGDQRRAVSIIDFGICRIVLNTDLTNYL